MQKYAKFNEDGTVFGFYSPDVHGPIQVPVYGPLPEPTEADPAPDAPIIGYERNSAYPEGTVPITDDQWNEILVNPGTRRWQNGTLITVPLPVIPAPAVQVISDRQFFTQLALDKVITFEEAEATSDGTMPKLLMDILDGIPDATERFKARMLAKNATSFDIAQPLVAVVAAALKWGPVRLQKLWTDASKL